MDRLTSMAVFVRCADAGSLAAAARGSGLSHAMVTKHVRALEAALGVRLLDLTTRSLALTEAGRRYRDRCARILSEVEEAALDAAREQAEPRGLLRLTAPATFGELHLGPAIATFLERHREVEIEAEFTDRFVGLVDENFDLAVRIGRLRDSSLVARRLGPSRMLTCAAPAYLDRFGAPAHPLDLAGHACLCLTTASNPGIWWYRDRDGAEVEVPVHGRLRANGLALLCRVAEEGQGIVFAPSFALGPLVQAGRLHQVLAAFPSRALDIHAVFPSSRHLSAKVRGFVDFLAQRFGDAPPWDVPQ